MLLQAILNAGDAVLGVGWLELPASYAEGLFKGATHRYIKRVPSGTTKSGKVRYRYFYHVGHGGTVANEDHFVVGAAFKHGDGHYHITHRGDEGGVVIKHDETGHEQTISKSALASVIAGHHEAGLKAHKSKIMTDWTAAHENGASDKQKAKIRARATAAGIGATKLRNAADVATPAAKAADPAAPPAVAMPAPPVPAAAERDAYLRSKFGAHPEPKKPDHRSAAERGDDAELAKRAHEHATKLGPGFDSAKLREDANVLVGASNTFGDRTSKTDMAKVRKSVQSALGAAKPPTPVAKPPADLWGYQHDGKEAAAAKRAEPAPTEPERLEVGQGPRGAQPPSRHVILAAHENAAAWHADQAKTADDKRENEYGKTAKQEHEGAAASHRTAANEWKGEIKGGMAALESGTLSASSRAWRNTDDAKKMKTWGDPADRAAHISREIAKLKRSRSMALADVEDRIATHLERNSTALGKNRGKGGSVPAGVSPVTQLHAKSKPTKEEKALMVEYATARKNAEANTDADARTHGDVWDYQHGKPRPDLGFSYKGPLAALANAIGTL